jgi:hypothetical protein
VPSLVARLLLGVDLATDAAIVARVAGMALIGLAIACWPGKAASRAAMVGMMTYSFTVALYLSYLGIASAQAGPLLWPAVAVHFVLTFLLLRSTLAKSS